MHPYPKRACLEGLEAEIFKMVSYSATPEQWKEWLRVPLEHAAARGNLDIFNKLLGAGANGSAGWRGCRDRTLLDAAAVGGNEDVVSGLLRVGSQPDVNVVSCSSRRSALYTATMLGHEAVARRLVVAGADVNFRDPVRQMSVLYEATLGGYEQLATELLIGGADPNCRGGEHGASPLHVAASRGFGGIMSTLQLEGADKDALDNEGETPLMWASKRGHLSVVKTLLAAGADEGIRSAYGDSALDYAASEGYGDVINAIVGHGADVDAGDDDGFTALHTAASHDQVDAVNALVEAEADVELKNSHGVTPLANAAYCSNGKAMLALLQHGAKVEVRRDSGDTPLHLACLGRVEGLAAAVDLLLRWGADETALNNNGESPVELLDVEYDGEGNINKPATQDEIDRTRLLLARAPVDRTWRRRGWLVMLCSRHSKAAAGNTSSHDHGNGGEGEGCEATMTEITADDVEYDERRNTDDGEGDGREAEHGGMVIDRTAGQLGHKIDGAARTTSNDHGGVVGAEGGEEGLRLEVLPLLGLRLDGVFRTVVGFL